MKWIEMEENEIEANRIKMSVEIKMTVGKGVK